MTRSSAVSGLGQAIIAIVCAIVSVATAGLGGQSKLAVAAPADAALNADKLREATALLEQLVTGRKIAGAAAAVAHHGKIGYLQSVGVQDLETRTPMTEHSLFRIYSMTRAVTAVAVMMFVEQGTCALDDPVAKYLPEFRNVAVQLSDGGTRAPSRPITIGDLLLHTSGLNYRTSPEYQQAQVRVRTIALPEFITRIVRVPLMEDPGTRYRYSESTNVLGRLVEVWSGQSLDAFLEGHVFRPLGMVDSRFWAGPGERSRLTTVYAPADGGGLRAIETEPQAFTERPALIEGAVGLLSSAHDFIRFSQMLVNKGELDGVRLLKPSTIALMTVNGLPPAILQTRRGGAMGWTLLNVEVVMDPAAVPYPSRRGELSWDGTAGTIFWVDPEKELATVLMAQVVPTDPDRIRSRFKTIVEEAVY